MSQSILFIGRKNEQFIDPSVNECYRVLGPAAGIIFDVDVVALLPSSSLSILCVKASRQKTYSNCDANVINKIEAVLKVKVIYSFRDTHLTDLWSGHFADTSNQRLKSFAKVTCTTYAPTSRTIKEPLQAKQQDPTTGKQVLPT